MGDNINIINNSSSSREDEDDDDDDVKEVDSESRPLLSKNEDATTTTSNAESAATPARLFQNQRQTSPKLQLITSTTTKTTMMMMSSSQSSLPASSTATSNQLTSLTSISPRNAYMSSIHEHHQQKLHRHSTVSAAQHDRTLQQQHHHQQQHAGSDRQISVPAAAAASFAADFAGASSLGTRGSTGWSSNSSPRREQFHGQGRPPRLGMNSSTSIASGLQLGGVDGDARRISSNNNSLSSTPVDNSSNRSLYSQNRSSIPRHSPTSTPSSLSYLSRASRLDEFASWSEGSITTSLPHDNAIDSTQQLLSTSASVRRASISGPIPFTTTEMGGQRHCISGFRSIPSPSPIIITNESLIAEPEEYEGDVGAGSVDSGECCDDKGEIHGAHISNNILERDNSPALSASRFPSHKALDLDLVADYISRSNGESCDSSCVTPATPMTSISISPHKVFPVNPKTPRFMFYSDLTGQISAPTFESLPLQSTSVNLSVSSILTQAPFWIDVCQPTTEEMNMFTRIFGIHPLTTEDIQTDDTREKCEVFPNYYFISYRTFDADQFSPGFLQPIHMFIVVFKECVLSVSFGFLCGTILDD